MPAQSQSGLERTLVTILVADFVGFSALMAQREEETVRILQAHRSVVDSIIELRGGRIFNTAGDSILAEFRSPVEAVRSAMEIQEALLTRNLNFREDRRLHLRIGIHLGDVIVRGTDLLGDAVYRRNHVDVCYRRMSDEERPHGHGRYQVRSDHQPGP